MFFFERGENMANETIDHVLEVENTISKIRDDAQLKIRQINYDKQESIEQIKNDLSQELREFKSTKMNELDVRLESAKNENKQSVQAEAENYERMYDQKKDQMTDYIIKEVLKRYGS